MTMSTGIVLAMSNCVSQDIALELVTSLAYNIYVIKILTEYCNTVGIMQYPGPTCQVNLWKMDTS